MATPELTADLQLPSSLDVLGQRVDLAPLQVGLVGVVEHGCNFKAGPRACTALLQCVLHCLRHTR